MTDPNNATRTFVYDDGGRMTAATDAENRETSYLYDAIGRRTGMTDARGITITSTFDDAGQLTGQVSPNETRSYSYDNVGRRTAWSDASGATTVAYDDAGRMTGITTPAGTVDYGYNAAGEQTSMTQPEGAVTTSYDQNGYVAGVADWRGDTIAMTNDADGRMLNAERSNGVDTNYWYDTAGRLTGVDHANTAGPIDGFQYMLDGNGNRTMVASNAGSESYTIDALNRITNASYPGGLTETFVYDDAGNRTSHTKTDGTTVGYTVDSTGQLVSDTTGTTYTYDEAGNLTATSGGDSYTYDDYGRTTAVTSNGVTATFGYDAANVRVNVNGEAQLWDRNGGLPTLISTGAGDNYVHTAGISRDGDDWLLQDAVGSVRATVDQTGATTGSQDFTVFGEQLTGTGTFGFAGEQQDPTGQLHLRARQYNPGLGRFTSVDPVQPGAPATTGYNLYAYSGNNPTTWTDPSGQSVLVESASLRSQRASRVGAVAARHPAVFGCLRDAIIGSAFELGTVAATENTFSAGRLTQTALTDCAVGAAFGQFRVSKVFNSFGVGGRRITNFFEGFTAVGVSDALFGEGFSIERAIAGGVFAGGLGEIGERFAAGLANAATRARLERIIPNVISRNAAGPVFAGVLDRRTGEIFFGLNQAEVPTDLHPILRDRLDDWIATGGRQGDHVNSAPGAHAEVFALSEALNARGAEVLSSLQDFVVVTLRTRGAARNTPIPPCDVCGPLTQGTIDGN